MKLTEKLLLILAGLVLCLLAVHVTKTIAQVHLHLENLDHSPKTDWNSLFRLATKETNTIEISFGPGTYGRVAILSDEPYPLLIHASAGRQTWLTNTLIIDSPTNAPSLLMNFNFDMTGSTNGGPLVEYKNSQKLKPMNPKFEEAQFFHKYWADRLQEITRQKPLNWILASTLFDRCHHWALIALNSLESPPAIHSPKSPSP